MRAILTYHSIDPSGSVISIDQAIFRSHVEWLASGRVSVLSVPDLVAASDSSDAVAITFDDGFENLVTAAWPLLRDHALPATVFVVTDAVGGMNHWESTDARHAVPRLPLLGWNALAQLVEEGAEVGSHSKTHARLVDLAPDDVKGEVAGSAERIHTELGTRPAVFAYPYGDANRSVAEVVGNHYAFGCTAELTAIRAAEVPQLLPRIDMYYFRHPGLLERWGTPAFRRRLWMRARGRNVRSLLNRVGRAPRPRPTSGH